MHDGSVDPDDFVPILTLGVYKGNPACRTLDFTCDVGPITVAGFLTAVVECMVDQVPENKQIEFEADVMKTFRKIVKTRHERTGKFYLPPEE